jgi:hypothetical protein
MPVVLDAAFHWTTMGVMEIKETPVFSRRLPDVMDDEEYAFLQFALIVNPQMGVVIPGTGGIRKLRWRGAAGASAAGPASSTSWRWTTYRSSCCTSTPGTIAGT